jgi:hypothetical protein
LGGNIAANSFGNL